MLKIISRFFLVLFLIIIQTSFLKGLGQPYLYLNFLLILTVWWIIGNGLDESLKYILAGAFLLDLFAGSFFGLILITIFLTAYLLDLICLYIITNKSLTSLLVLGVVSVWLYSFLFLLISELLNWVNIIEQNIVVDIQYWQGVIWQTGFTILGLFGVYLWQSFFGKENNL